MNTNINILQLNNLISSLYENVSNEEMSLPTPKNGGEAVEYSYAYHLSLQNEQNPAKIVFKNKIFTPDVLLSKIEEYEREKNKSIDNKKVETAVKSFLSSSFYTDLVKKNDYIDSIVLTGVTESGKSSADILIKTKNGKITKSSIKKAGGGSTQIYQTGSEAEKVIKKSLKQEGGGLHKLYNIFKVGKYKETKNIQELYQDLALKLGQKYENPQLIPEYFKILKRLIQRDDSNVDLLQMVYQDKIIFPNLLASFLDHITSIKHYIPEGEFTQPYIRSSVTSVESFDPLGSSLKGSKELKTKIEKKLKKDFSSIENEYNNFLSQFNSLNDKQKSLINKRLQGLNIGLSSVPNEFSKIFKTLKLFVDKNLNKLNNADIIQIRRREDLQTNYIEKRSGLQVVSDISEFFSYLENKREFKFIVNILNGLFKLSMEVSDLKKPKSDKLTEYIKNEYKFYIFENINKDKILNKIKKKINSLDKKNLGIISITPSNKSDAALVVRCEDKENIESVRSAVKSAIDGIGFSANNRVIAKFEPSTESTEVPMSDGSGGVYIVYKYDIGSREGLALEHVMGLLLTKKVTPELKNRLDLPPEASKEEVKEKLKTDYADVLSTAFQGKKLIDEKIGEITDARSEGSRNSKADLILTTADDHTYGLSIKLVTEQGREVRFTYNKNLGYGDDEEDTLVKSPNGRPWWLIGRQNFAKKLGRQFKGNPEDLEPPGWMTKAKESKSEAYKEAMEETYAALREVFVGNLKRMKLKEIVDMVNEAHNGGEQEEQYEKLFVLTSDADGVRLEAKGHEQPDIQKIKMSGIDKSDIVKTDGAKIIIDIPGMSPLTIHGLKFHSNMLSSNREDLKIKTR